MHLNFLEYSFANLSRRKVTMETAKNKEKNIILEYEVGQKLKSDLDDILDRVSQVNDTHKYQALGLDLSVRRGRRITTAIEQSMIVNAQRSSLFVTGAFTPVEYDNLPFPTFDTWFASIKAQYPNSDEAAFRIGYNTLTARNISPPVPRDVSPASALYSDYSR